MEKWYLNNYKSIQNIGKRMLESNITELHSINYTVFKVLSLRGVVIK